MSGPSSAEQLAPVWARAAVFVLGGTSVAPLLAWVFDLGSFRAWFLAVSIPGQLLLLAIALAAGHRPSLAGLRTLLVAGFVGGLVGTIGYDLFRVPFVIGGLRVLAPIDSYGVLALGADTSSPLTGFTGWAYHFANGIGFGISYAVLAGRGRRWGWGVGWALLLETATVVTPFATTYALAGKWIPISIAYAAHVPYGLAIGFAVQRADGLHAEMRTVGRAAIPGLIATLIVGLALWHSPWSVPDELEAARELVPAPGVLVIDGEFKPEWLRVRPGGCATLDNQDDTAYRLSHGAPAVVPARTTTVVCFAEPGVHRVRTSDGPYAGGFVIVDAAG